MAKIEKSTKKGKTNAMRLLDTAGVAYTVKEYTFDPDDFDGRHVAEQVGMEPGQVFKTLVTRGPKGAVCVCCIPVDKHLDLKALAACAGEKSLELVKVDELLGLTGYVRGGCSPLGMKKEYPTFLDESAMVFEEIAVSAGVRGKQVLLPPQALQTLTRAKTGAFTRDMV
ncbi:Cys-tRNA(Pro) deacylase [Ruminococcaceae bacterium OttesenSCG-928-L11]|nr:Cys-tRNA(Pro) deacylase [Ruminococcaceae bacterium OttesenSCG-928-L11]